MTLKFKYIFLGLIDDLMNQNKHRWCRHILQNNYQFIDSGSVKFQTSLEVRIQKPVLFSYQAYIVKCTKNL